MAHDTCIGFRYGAAWGCNVPPISSDLVVHPTRWVRKRCPQAKTTTPFRWTTRLPLWAKPRQYGPSSPIPRASSQTMPHLGPPPRSPRGPFHCPPHRWREPATTQLLHYPVESNRRLLASHKSQAGWLATDATDALGPVGIAKWGTAHAHSCLCSPQSQALPTRQNI